MRKVENAHAEALTFSWNACASGARTSVDTASNAQYEVSAPRELSRVDDILRRRLIHALKDRRWANLDAERAAARIAELYHSEAGEWGAWPRKNAMGPDLYRVARDEAAMSVYDSPIQGRALDVASVLNEFERHGADATGWP